MPASEHFFCPHCNARLKFGRRPKPHVTCPRCGRQFDYNVPASALDPFAEDVEEQHPPEDPAGPPGATTEFGMLLNEIAEAKPRAPRDIDFGDEVIEAPTEDAEVDYGPPVAVPVGRADPSTWERRPADVPKRKGGKKKKRAGPFSDAIWLYLGGAGLLALVLFIIAVIVRPAFLFGPPLTSEVVAGTYVSEEDHGFRIRLGADGTCGISDEGRGGSLKVDGFVYSIKGNRITIEKSEEMKPEPKPRIFLDRPPQLPGFNLYDAILADVGDLTFKNGTLTSPGKGRFTRETDLEKE